MIWLRLLKVSQELMKYNFLTVLVVTLLILCAFPRESVAKVEMTPKITVVYSNDSEDQFAVVNRLDALFSSYGHTTVVNIEKLEASQLEKSTHIVYMGLSKEVIANDVVTLFKQNQKPKLFIGYNAQQFDNNPEMSERLNSDLIEVNDQSLARKSQFIDSNLNAKTIVFGKTIEKEVPLLIQMDEEAYYLALLEFTEEMDTILRPFISHDFIGQKAGVKEAFIIINDITPQTKANVLKKKMDQFKKLDIPYMLGVTSATLLAGEKQSFLELKENTELVTLLKKEQQNGVAILAEGYANAYHYVTGYGQEFWDKEFDGPITSLDPLKAHDLKKRSEFESATAFDKYRQEIGKIEETYTEKRLVNAINSLSDIGIYPIAFSLKDGYASDYVYRTINKHFSTYFGNLQYSNEDSSKRGVQAWITQPNFMDGLTVYPINLQGVTEDPTSENTLFKSLQSLSQNPKVMAGIQINVASSNVETAATLTVFSQFPEFIWLDPGKIPTVVKTDNIEIQQFANGKTTMDLQNKYMYRMKTKLANEPFEFALWILFIIVLAFVTVFFINVIRLRVTLKKRLFEERKPNG